MNEVETCMVYVYYLEVSSMIHLGTPPPKTATYTGSHIIIDLYMHTPILNLVIHVHRYTPHLCTLLRILLPLTECQDQVTIAVGVE